MLNQNIVYVTGLPRAGSTLLCQLLSHHVELYATGHSSPLCSTLTGLRQHLSDDVFFRAQLDVDFDLTYQRLTNAFQGFMNGWFAETDKRWVVDKNRGWLQHIETVAHLDPNFKMLVCVRELGQVYGSVEAQHQKTLLLDFPDHLANLSRYDRADRLFAAKGVVGEPMQSMIALQDLGTELQNRLYYVVFEHLMQDPAAVMGGIYEWLGLPAATFDPQNLAVRPHESDSYYRFKYPHETRKRISPPTKHTIPPRIQQQIQEQFSWFYKTFYPGLIDSKLPTLE
ncbi:sulfotransferase [cf. Phormidesmis sp. LEGE 11477]|uniref:sulfotransferase family protein n=1 Tax=cf. Phormidesmis sp. LEGE 11477 TaxID=1828680 RepID=UPI001881305C|nr:sulfotransferase [cf. Phormidesmis sp. LEGE 11477]MBE9064369.1 sulfotransferase [cf. Phormidesmis sp. LEGE 11477]